MANEKRLIDANALAQFIEKRTGGVWIYKPDFRWAVTQQPTVDAVEVVRCKDCQSFSTKGYEEGNEHEEDLCLHMGWCTSWRRGTQACAFCSYGERREGNG